MNSPESDRSRSSGNQADPGSRISAGIKLAQDVATVVREQQVAFLAAAVAYYALVSLLPALLLALVVSTTFFGEQMATAILLLAGEFVTPIGREAIMEAIAGAAGRAGATLAGIVVLLWSTLKLFRALDVAFMRVYGAEESIGIADQLLDAVIVAGSVGGGAALMVVIGTTVAALNLPGVFGLTSVLVLPAVLLVVFFPLYYLLPYPEVGVREALPGTAIAAGGWSLLQAGFQLYASVAGGFQLYGLIGGFLLLVTWLYFAAIVLLIGAAVNAVLSGDAFREGDGVSPSPSRGITRLKATLGRSESRDREARPPSDRQLQHSPVRERARMADDDREEGESTATSENTASDARTDGSRPAGAPDVAAMQAELEELRAELETFERDVEERTVEKPQLEEELKQYVRSRLRRGHARGWGPYLVLLYGVVLTLGAFYYLSGGWAIAAMIVLALSTLGLYVLFLLVGVGLNAASLPSKTIDYIRDRR